MNCDCWIGIFHDYDQSDTNNLYLSDVKNKVVARSELNSSMATIAKGRYKLFRPIAYLDKRHNLSRMFNYCPNCGTKINWPKIKKEVKEV